MENLNISLIQSDIFLNDLEKNFTNYEELLANHNLKNSDIIVFPEMFNTGISKETDVYATNNDSISVKFLKSMSEKYNADTVGSMGFKNENGEGKYTINNRLFWIRDNEILGHYDKKHIFFGNEKDVFTPGNAKLSDRLIIEKKSWRMMPVICYDIRFPMWCRNNYDNNRFLYDILIVTTNFTKDRVDVLKRLAAARAIENMSYVAVINRIGQDPSTEYNGGTFVMNPYGEIINECSINKQEVLTTTLDYNELTRIRRHIPVWMDWDNIDSIKG